MGQLVGARIQLCVGELGARPLSAQRWRLHESERVGPGCGLRFKELVHPQVRGHDRGGVVPVAQDLVTFGRAEHGQTGHWRVRIGHGSGEQDLQVAEHPPDGGFIEQVGVVLRAARQPAGRLAQGQGEVEGRDAGVDVQLAESQPRQLQGRLVGPAAVQREHDLEQRRVAEVTPRLERVYYYFEGQVLVRIRGQGGFPRPRQQLAERRRAAEVGAQHQRVDEEADQALDLGAVTVGDGRADAEDLLARVAAQQRLEPSQHGHEQRGIVAPAQGLELGRQLGGQAEREVRAAGGLHGRPRPVRGQVQGGRQVGQRRLPVVKLPVAHLAGEPVALPGGKIDVLHRQGRQGRGRRIRRRICGVERGELACQHAAGPAVGDDVVHGQERNVRLGAEAQQGRAYQRTGSQVERPPCFCGRVLLHGCRLLRLRQRA